MFAFIGIILIIAGAIIAFGIDSAVEGVDLLAIGYILMGGGALALLVAAVQGAGFMSMRNNRYRTERHASPDGQHVVQETEIQ